MGQLALTRREHRPVAMLRLLHLRHLVDLYSADPLWTLLICILLLIVFCLWYASNTAVHKVYNSFTTYHRNPPHNRVQTCTNL
jgi:choline-glycine betaine transporter